MKPPHRCRRPISVPPSPIIGNPRAATWLGFESLLADQPAAAPSPTLTSPAPTVDSLIYNIKLSWPPMLGFEGPSPLHRHHCHHSVAVCADVRARSPSLTSASDVGVFSDLDIPAPCTLPISMPWSSTGSCC